MDACDVLELKILKGVEPSVYTLGETVPGNDPVPEFIDLLDPTSTFKLQTENGVGRYEYGIAGLKNGGVTTDSAITDGYTLVATPLDNVTETVTLVSENGDDKAVAAAMAKFNQYTRYIHDFQNTTYQPDPVYVKVRLVGDAGARYALLVDMSASIVGDTLPGEIRQLVITWIREPGWRWLAPGANPKIYAFERRGLIPVVDYDEGDLSLIAFGGATDLRSFFEGTANNANTWSSATITYQNYVEVGAIDSNQPNYIPGDLPALVSLIVSKESVAAPTYSPGTLFVSRSIKANNPAPLGNLQRLNLNGGDAALTATTNVAVAYTTTIPFGVRCDPPGAPTENYYVAQFTYATGAIADGVRIAAWTNQVLQNNGKFRVFVRNHVVSGTNTNAPFRIRVSVGGTAIFTSDILVPTAGGTNPTMLEIGNLDLFGVVDDAPNVDGTGRSQSLNYEVEVLTSTRGVVGTSTVWYITDVVLVPYDECAIAQESVAPTTTTYIIFDNTGYFSRGRQDSPARLYSSGVTNPYPFKKSALGQALSAEPGVINRFFFLQGSPGISPVQYTVNDGRLTVRVNVVPRSRHLRDRV